MLNQHRHIHLGILIAVCLLVGNFLVAQINLTYNTAEAADEILLTQSDITYVGAFRLPPTAIPGNDATSFSFGGTALAFNPANGTLFIVGHDGYQRTAEVNIPAIVKAGTIAGHNIATIRQPLTDVLAGHRDDVGTETKIGGQLPYGDSLLVTSYRYYDGSGSQSRSHFVTSLDFSNIPAPRGPYQILDSRAGFVSGWMASVPTEWQNALGGDVLTGQCCISIISRTSYGPSATVFKGTDMGRIDPVPAVRVLGYTSTQTTLGGWSSTGTLFNGTTKMGGMVFPPGTRSVLFIGRRGVGAYCYGEGTTENPPGIDSYGNPRCYDPSSSSKGNHSYPYESFVWAYDVADFLAVKQGTKAPWEIVPYATWSFDVPFQISSRIVSGVAYDSATRRLFVSTAFGDSSRPLIHVFQINNATPVPNPAPAPTPTPTPSPTPTPITGAMTLVSNTASVTLGQSYTLTATTDAQTVHNIKLDGVTLYTSSNCTSTICTKSITKTPTATGTITHTLTATDANSVPYTPVTVSVTVSAATPIVGDFNQDSIVNSLDWSYMNSKWFTNDAKADLNRDGIVNSIDFSILNRNWFKTTP